MIHERPSKPLSFGRIEEVTAGVPWMDPGRGRWLAQFLRDQNIRRCLEVGILHGSGTCWIAGAIAHIPGAKVWALDLPSSAQLDPNAESLLAKLGLSVGGCGDGSLVHICRDVAGASWTLVRMLRWRPRWRLDFAYIDADHTLESTLLYWYLAGQAIRPGGWILFDDIGNPDYPALDYAWTHVIKETPGWDGRGAMSRGLWRLIQKRADAPWFTDA